MSSGAATKKRKVAAEGDVTDENGAPPASVSASDVIKTCQPILKFIMSKTDAEPFSEPVDWEELGIPDYPDVVQNPMDLGTVKSKLEGGQYATEFEFAEDVRLVWHNAKIYNQPGSGIYVAADNLAKQFDKRLGKVGKKPESTDVKSAAGTPVTSKKKKAATPAAGGKLVTQADKVKFSTVINSLSATQIGKVVEMIQIRCPAALNEDDEEDLEIEVDKIDRASLAALNAFCESCINNAAQSADGAKKKKK